MSRYDNTRVKYKKDFGRTYSYTIYPKVPIKNSDVFITPTYGTRLELLAFEYYQDTSLWWIIAQANGIKGFTSLYPNNFKGQLLFQLKFKIFLRNLIL